MNKKLLCLVSMGMVLLFVPLFGMGKRVEKTPVSTAKAGVTEKMLAKDFTLTDLKGNRIRLSDYRGQRVLLVFWATWCAPCVKEIPELNHLASLEKKKNLKIIAVNVEGAAKRSVVKKFMDKYNVSYLVLVDDTQSVTKAYKVLGIPTNILIDEQGMILSRGYTIPKL